MDVTHVLPPYPWLQATSRHEAKVIMRALIHHMDSLVAEGCPPPLAWALIFGSPVVG